MAYNILAKDGRPIKKDGDPIKAMDITIEKIEQLDNANKSFVAVASTEDEDRHKDIVRQDGWKLTNFKKNPMIPWSHDYWGVPIARSLKTWVDKEAKKLMFKPQFDADDEASMKIYNKYKNGFLTSFSVGFRNLKSKYRNEDERWFGGTEFLEQELLEISAVTIPANPNATVSLNGDESIQNLLQLGYPQKYAETEHGLFYPIREELGEFINPEVKDLEDDVEGIQGVYANIISELKEDGSGGIAIPVGYYFDPEIWSTVGIKSWINDNHDKTYKFHYYNWKWIDENKDFEIEDKEEEKEIPDFDEPIKITTPNNVPLAVLGDDIDDNDDADAVSHQCDDGSDTKKIIEVLDKHLEAISNGVVLALEKFNESLFEIKSLLNKKTVDSDLQIDDNKSNDDLDSSDDDDKSNSKSDDDIEIDDSLLSPDNDKNNDNDIIELDDDLLSNKDDTKIAVKSVFSEKLKETLKEVRDSFKIEV